MTGAVNSLTSYRNYDAPKFVRRGQGPDPVDVHVGNRVREARFMSGLSQEKLGRMVGITFQQLQKYERGANRISASMLHRLVRALDLPHSFFFAGYDDDLSRSANVKDVSFVDTRRNLEVIRNLSLLDEDIQIRVYLLIKSMAEADDPGGSDDV